MFTGIVSGLGTLVAREGSQFVIHTPYKRKSLELGASLACDGCCLTLTQIEKAKGEGSLVAVDVSNETLSHTTLGSWERDRKINLERALSLGEELGDLLFVVVNLAKWLGIDAESALREANLKFSRRFRALEKLAESRQISLAELGLDDLEALWQEVKVHLKE